jgi:hypothetical protein
MLAEIPSRAAAPAKLPLHDLREGFFFDKIRRDQPFGDAANRW